MKREAEFEVLSNAPIADSVYEMTLAGDTSDFTAPGQFVNIKLDGFFLRRPISVCDWEDNRLTLIYKAIGDGTRYMSSLIRNDRLSMLTALGNGFDTSSCRDGCVLVGGGVGCPPIYSLGKQLHKNGIGFTAVLGFNGQRDIILRERFEEICDNVIVCTADGSVGVKGFVTNGIALLESKPEQIFACGPMPMLKALCALNTSGAVSLEERMACGFGGCMGCTIMTRSGAKRVCKDGPVFDISEVMFE